MHHKACLPGVETFFSPQWNTLDAQSVRNPRSERVLHVGSSDAHLPAPPWLTRLAFGSLLSWSSLSQSAALISTITDIEENELLKVQIISDCTQQKLHNEVLSTKCEWASLFLLLLVSSVSHKPVYFHLWSYCKCWNSHCISDVLMLLFWKIWSRRPEQICFLWVLLDSSVSALTPRRDLPSLFSQPATKWSLAPIFFRENNDKLLFVFVTAVQMLTAPRVPLLSQGLSGSYSRWLPVIAHKYVAAWSTFRTWIKHYGLERRLCFLINTMMSTRV